MPVGAAPAITTDRSFFIALGWMLPATCTGYRLEYEPQDEGVQRFARLFRLDDRQVRIHPRRELEENPVVQHLRLGDPRQLVEGGLALHRSLLQLNHVNGEEVQRALELLGGVEGDASRASGALLAV